MAMSGMVFLDTSVLLGGVIDMGPPSVAAQRVMAAIAEGRLEKPATAWHCCLELYAVATRLPEELRLSPADALAVLEHEVLGRLEVVDLPAAARRAGRPWCPPYRCRDKARASCARSPDRC